MWIINDHDVLPFPGIRFTSQDSTGSALTRSNLTAVLLGNQNVAGMQVPRLTSALFVNVSSLPLPLNILCSSDKDNSTHRISIAGIIIHVDIASYKYTTQLQKRK